MAIIGSNPEARGGDLIGVGPVGNRVPASGGILLRLAEKCGNIGPVMPSIDASRGIRFSLRSASPADKRAIRRPVRISHLYPLGLDWRRFVVAVSGEDCVAGIGQIKRHRGGALELASIVVDPRWRGQGVATALIERLLGGVRKEILLGCHSSLTAFYRKFGFDEFRSPRGVPLDCQAAIKMSVVMRLLSRKGEYVAVMRRPRPILRAL